MNIYILFTPGHAILFLTTEALSRQKLRQPIEVMRIRHQDLDDVVDSFFRGQSYRDNKESWGGYIDEDCDWQCAFDIRLQFQVARRTTGLARVPKMADGDLWDSCLISPHCGYIQNRSAVGQWLI
jgi:hypothetical protein